MGTIRVAPSQARGLKLTELGAYSDVSKVAPSQARGLKLTIANLK